MKAFRESQKFNQWWLWALLLVLFGVLMLNGIDIFERTESWLGFLGPAVIAVLMILFALVELRTTITQDGVEAYFWPFGKRRVFRSEIVGAEVKKYRVLRELGGWGYRITATGRAFNMYGNQGLELHLQDGSTLMIGTQQPEELREFMHWYLEEEDTLTDEAVSLRLKEPRFDDLER